MNFTGRIVHMLLFTVPVLMYFLHLDRQTALLADIGLSLLIVVYSLAFNWIFDHALVRLHRDSAGSGNRSSAALRKKRRQKR